MTLQDKQNTVTLEADRVDDRIQATIWSQSPPGLVFMRGDMLVQDGDRASGIVMIDAYAGQEREGTPFCSATASVLMTPSASARIR